MKKPSALIQLLSDLKEIDTDTSVVTLEGSHALIFLETDPIRLSREEVELVFHSVHTVEQLYSALDEPKDAAIELHSLSLDDDVMDTLERLFAAVDEG